MSGSENVTISSVDLESETTNTVETSQPPSTLASAEGTQTPRGSSDEADHSSVIGEEINTNSSSDEDWHDLDSDDQWETDHDATENFLDDGSAELSKSSMICGCILFDAFISLILIVLGRCLF